MPFISIDGPNGVMHAHVNLGRHKPKRCRFCNTGYAERLCDFPLVGGRTCSKGMCERCATAVADGVDYCPNHRGRPVRSPEAAPQPVQGELPL